MSKYYLTDHGNILNIKKKCFQTPMGKFLRLVSDNEMEYLKNILIPIKFPNGIYEPENTPLWHFIYHVENDGVLYDYFGRDNNGIVEFCYVSYPSYVSDYYDDYDYYDVKIIDVNIDYYLKYYLDINESVLYHFATPCFRQDVLEYEYLLTEDQIDERNKNLLLIGISDFKKRRTRK